MRLPSRLLPSAFVKVFEKNFQTTETTSGDLIICRGYNDYHNKEVVYPQGIIVDVHQNGKLVICVEPMVPHLLASGKLSVSGGYWFCCDKQEINRSQEVSGERTFWVWDSYGPRAQGCLYFQARVKVWEISSRKVY